MLTVLYSGEPDLWPVYRPALTAALREAGIAARLVLPGEAAPESVDYIVFAPSGPVTDFTPYRQAKAVLSLWAGVERVVGNPTLTQPLCRMVDEGLERGMVEWVAGQVLRHHLGLDRHITGQDGVWRNDQVPPLAPERGVTVLGLGVLGRACATALATLGFRVTGWSRSPKDVPGIACLHGPEGLNEALRRAEILVSILPDTPETNGLLNAETLALLPQGAVVLNPGRGTLIDDAALLSALDAGQVGHATLDVFRTEPLPPDHPYWTHPHVTVTPHIAAATRPGSASAVIAENIRRGEAGEPFLHRVDRDRGY
ncbi:glyoxylate/hydroxypyruvate reductase A [Sinirhodobacter populi]|uniref:Glyoxylate/hydroxypyruvate reductase A n=1 Tax=Paenirhodobacter populi TaxID=2306993 RepID=A0A443K9M3_9RHOB|nr:glyoxylate/hydroxypyruvate reductase A [Sinirhodobacter populi]RWR29445.1 glyoxylate/hydroxypyruvate reductase A [Sinirhodobacter populi]